MQIRFNRNPFVVSLVAILATLWVAVETAAAPPTLSFNADGATVNGISPRGETIWFVRSVTDFSGSPYLSRRLKLLNDDDGDGRVTMQLEVKPASVWVVVDFSTGLRGPI